MIRLFDHSTIYSVVFCPERLFRAECHPDMATERPENFFETGIQSMQQNIQERAGTALKTTAGMPLKLSHPPKPDYDSDSISDDKEKTT
jgi:hypothetical protein